MAVDERYLGCTQGVGEGYHNFKTSFNDPVFPQIIQSSLAWSNLTVLTHKAVQII